MGSKFYSRLDNKWFAKAEGQVTMWSRVSRASLHEEMWAEGRVGLPKGSVRKSWPRGGKEAQPWGGRGKHTPSEGMLSLSNLDLIFHRYFPAQNRDAVHVYWMTSKPVNATMSKEQIQFNRQTGLPKRLYAKCTGGRFSRCSNEFQKLNFTALFPGTFKEKWKSGFYYVRRNPSHSLLLARVQSQLSFKKREGCKSRRQEPHN